MSKKTWMIIAVAMIIFTFTGCREAERVSYNVSKEADNFNVTRRLTVINTRTDKCLLQMTGRMSIDAVTGGVEVLVEVDRDKGIYQKHYIWMNDWTMYTLEDLNGVGVDRYAYELEFMPRTLMPVKITTTEIEQDGDVFATILGGNENGSDDK